MNGQLYQLGAKFHLHYNIYWDLYVEMVTYFWNNKTIKQEWEWHKDHIRSCNMITQS
jgi:hypothetical protein